MWLRDEIDGSPFFAEDNGLFNLEDIQEFTTLDVEGPELKIFSQPGSSSSATVDSGNRTSAPPPVFKSVIATKKGANHSIKVRIRWLGSDAILK